MMLQHVQTPSVTLEYFRMRLVGGLEHELLNYFSHHFGNFIIPTDELHHFSEGWLETTNQITMVFIKFNHC